MTKIVLLFYSNLVLFNKFKILKFKNVQIQKIGHLMEQHTLKNVNNCLNTNIYSYLETSGGQSTYLN